MAIDMGTRAACPEQIWLLVVVSVIFFIIALVALWQREWIVAGVFGIIILFYLIILAYAWNRPEGRQVPSSGLGLWCTLLWIFIMFLFFIYIMWITVAEIRSPFCQKYTWYFLAFYIVLFLAFLAWLVLWYRACR